MWYNIKFNDNLITVTNLSSETEVIVSISLSETCTTDFTEIVKNIDVDLSKEFKLPFINGIYKIEIERISGTTVIETVEFTYPYFGVLLQSIIKDLDYFFCDCGCKDCEDCEGDETSKLLLMLKVMNYFTLTYKFFPRFYDAIFKCLYCDSIDISNCQILTEKLTGNSKTQLLFDKLLASFHLCFYFIEYYNNDNIESVNKKFKYNRISQCIKTANADINCIKENIENNMGLFTVPFDAYKNQPPSQVGNYTHPSPVVNGGTLVCTPSMFTTLTIPVYQDPEGDAAQAIRVDTLPTNGATLRLSGVAVTTGQIITMSAIAAGNLTLVGPSNVNLTNTVFNFSVRDTGSMQFVS